MPNFIFTFNVKLCFVERHVKVALGWDHELFQMNHDKVGEPYNYPDSFIQLLGYMRAYFHLPYRQTQGVVMAHKY